MGDIKIAACMRLATEAGCDVRTARKAIVQGAAAIRGQTGERIEEAAKRIGLVLGGEAA
jgi:hypothetical protein